MSSEDKLFDVLRQVPFEEVLSEFLDNLNVWDLEQRIQYLYSKGWTRNEFNERWSKDLEP